MTTPLWTLKKKEKKKIAKQTLKNFLEEMNKKYSVKEKPVAVEITLFTKAKHGNSLPRGEIDNSYTTKTLTKENIAEQITKYKRKNLNTGNKLLEIVVPKGYKEILGEQIDGVLISERE